MAFSFRAYFGKENSIDDKEHASSPTSPGPSGGKFTSPFQMKCSNSSNNPPTAETDFASMFSVPASRATTGLTVADVLPLLPPDIAKNPMLSGSQVLHLSDEVLERARQNGLSAVPLFEIYRVCPAMFQTPISPMDPRHVPLPRPSAAPQNNAQSPGMGNVGKTFPFNVSAVTQSGMPSFQDSAAQNLPQKNREAPPAMMNSPFAILSPASDANTDSPFKSSHFFSMSGKGAEPAASPFTQIGQTAVPAMIDSPFSVVKPAEPIPVDAAFSNGFSAPHAPEMVENASLKWNRFSTPEAAPPMAASLPPASARPPGGNPFPPAPEAPSAPEPETAVMSFSFPAFQPVPEVGAQAPPFTGYAPPSFDFTPPAANTTAFDADFTHRKSDPSVAPAVFTPFVQTPENPAFYSSAAPTPLGNGSFLGVPPQATVAATDAFIRPAAFSDNHPLATPFYSISPAVPANYLSQSADHAPNADTIRMSLAAALRDCPQQDCGVNAEMIPAWIQVSLPMAQIRSKFALGRVRVSLSQIIEGLEPSFRSLLNNARPGAEVDLPVNEVFHALPATSATVAPAVVAARQIEPAPFAQSQPMAKMPEQQAFAKTTPEPAASFIPFTPPSWATAAKPQNDFIPKPVAPEWPPMLSAFEKPLPADHAATPFFVAPVPAPAPAVTIPSNPLTGTFEVVSPAPFAPSAIKKAPEAEPKTTSFTTQTNRGTKNIVLRALFGNSIELDPDGVLKQTGALPGVSAAICLHDGRRVAASSASSPDVEKFIEQATRLFTQLQPIVQFSGDEPTESISIQSNDRLVTCSFQGPTTLCVLHAVGNTQDGLHEKLTLISRELAQMLRESPPFA